MSVVVGCQEHAVPESICEVSIRNWGDPHTYDSNAGFRLLLNYLMMKNLDGIFIMQDTV